MATQRRDLTEINEKVQAYRDKLLNPGPGRPKLSPEEREQRLEERLTTTETALDRTDTRRVRLLLQAASLSAQREDWQAVYGYAVEIQTLCRTRVLGRREAYPILSTLPPSPVPRLSSPAMVELPPEEP